MDHAVLGHARIRRRPDSPPFLIVHGTRDETVPFEQGAFLHEALVDAGADVTFVPLIDRTHSGTASIDSPDDDWRYWELPIMALPFLVKHLRR